MDNEQLKTTVKQYMHDLFGGKKPPHKRSPPKSVEISHATVVPHANINIAA